MELAPYFLLFNQTQGRGCNAQRYTMNTTMSTLTPEEVANKIAELRAKHPKHEVALCTNGNIGRWRLQKFHTGKGSHTTHGVGKIVMKKILLAVY